MLQVCIPGGGGVGGHETIFWWIDWLVLENVIGRVSLY